MICFAAVAVIADSNAKTCKSNWSPTDIVANKRNEGRGTKGIKEPKKLTKVSPIYPTSGANGKMAAKSTIKAHAMDYLTKAKLAFLMIYFWELKSLKYHIFRPKANGQKWLLSNLWKYSCN